MEHEAHPPSPDSGIPVTFRRRGYFLVASIAAILVLLMIILVPQLITRSSAAGNDPAAVPDSTHSATSLKPSATPPASAEPSEPTEPSASALPSPAAVPPSGPVIPAPGDAQQIPDTVAAPAAAAPTRITVPAAGIDVAVLPLRPTGADIASQSIVPPFTDDGYWLTSYGIPGDGSTNTTYITGHSWEGREAPFDRFSTDTGAGDIITITTEAGTLDYVVDSITTHDKDSLKTSEIWDIVPNRLVIISCYTEDPWGKNVVVTASPANP
ncbi:hypothetical protein IWX75_000062 [Arthrobacter sp. CAN_A6]|uniref:class F sortase n=1 Tax=Arthrobacter sp. CAN_A6 TaxID=2787721 RepID=UPI0018C8E1D1